MTELAPRASEMRVTEILIVVCVVFWVNLNQISRLLTLVLGYEKKVQMVEVKKRDLGRGGKSSTTVKSDKGAMTYDDMESRLKGAPNAGSHGAGAVGMKDVTAVPVRASINKAGSWQHVLTAFTAPKYHARNRSLQLSRPGLVSKTHVKGDRQVEGKIRLHDVAAPRAPRVPAQRHRDWFHDALFAIAKRVSCHRRRDQHHSLLFLCVAASINRTTGGEPERLSHDVMVLLVAAAKPQHSFHLNSKPWTAPKGITCKTRTRQSESYDLHVAFQILALPPNVQH